MNDEEKELYKDSESFLNGLRKTYAGNTDVSTSVRGAIQGTTISYREDDEGTRQQTPISIGRIASNVSSEESRNRSSSETFTDDGKFARSDYSINQRDEFIRGPRNQQSFISSIKNTFKPFQDAYKERGKKGITASKSIPKKEDGKKLSDAEVIKLRPKLIESILWQSEHLDQFIIATTRGHDPEIEIWGNLDQDEAEILADFMLSRARVSARAAGYVRQAVELMSKIKVAAIVLPRMYRTLQTYLSKGIGLA